MTPPDSAPRREHAPEPNPFTAYKHLLYSTDNKERKIAFIKDKIWQHEELLELRDEINRLVPPAGVSDPAAMLEKVREALEDMLHFADGFSGSSTFEKRKKKARAALALLPPIRISVDASDTPAES